MAKTMTIDGNTAASHVHMLFQMLLPSIPSPRHLPWRKWQMNGLQTAE